MALGGGGQRSWRSMGARVALALATAVVLVQQVAALWLPWTHEGVMYRLRLPVFSYPYQARVRAYAALERSSGSLTDVWLGDSMVEGLPCARLHPSCLSLGIGGDTAFGVLHRIEHHPSLARAQRVHLLVGHNDLGKTDDASYVAALYARVLAALPAGPKIVCHAVLPVDERATDTRTNAAIVALNARLERTCTRVARARYVDEGRALIDATGNLTRELHVGDGVHLNDAGYARWLAALAANGFN